jgi:hypothetical protein
VDAKYRSGLSVEKAVLLSCDLRWKVVLSALCTVQCEKNGKHVQSLRKRVERLLLVNKRGW